jgi:hypothetical protein
MLSSQLGAGYALVPVPPDDNPDHGSSGWIRKSPNNALPAHAGNTVYRTPHLVVREAEAGANWPGDLSKMMFIQDGRLVPAEPYAYDMFRGAADPSTCGPGAAAAFKVLVPAVAMFSGAAIGYRVAAKHQAWAAIGGAVVGGILGMIFR